MVVDRASQSQAPSHARTLDSLDIPHYRLGTPHFTERGSAVLHSSVHTGSSPRNEGLATGSSDNAARYQRERFEPQVPKHEAFPSSGTTLTSTVLKRTLHKAKLKEPPLPSFSGTQPTEQPAKAELDAHQRQHSVESDIRVSTATGQLLAASVPQLIAQITSPKLLDYELLSDFFLSYRQFMSSSDLAIQLISRLQNAIRSSDEFSRVVRVRTFVALRHWILNYFVDDFVMDFELRARFCMLVNRLCRALEREAPRAVGDLRIVEELKKCWRHTCALFWEMPPSASDEDCREDILPGGYVGSQATPLEWDHGPLASAETQLSLEDDELSRDPSPVDSVADHDFAFNQTQKLGSSTTTSMSSVSKSSHHEHQPVQATSFSIPAQMLTSCGHQRGSSTGSQPLPSFAEPAKSSTHPPSCADQARKHHSRSGSFSDALRDDRVPLPTPQNELNDQLPAPMILPGSLIRGATVEPGNPYVEEVMTSSPTHEPDNFDFQIPPSAVASGSPRGRQLQPPNPGVRRFLGSVRRALSAKNAVGRALTPSPHRGRHEAKVPNSPFRAPTKRETSAQKRKLVDGKAAMRIDMLAEEVQRSFKNAVQQVREAQEALQFEQAEIPARQEPDASAGSQALPRLQIPQNAVRDTNVTNGSRSIVIMDDTNGQITPRADRLAAEETLAQLESERRSSQPWDLGIHSVPLFLDTGAEEPTEPLDNESQFFGDSPITDTKDAPDPSPRYTTTASAGSGMNSSHARTLTTSQEPQVIETEISSRGTSFAYTATTYENPQDLTENTEDVERAPPARQLRRLPAGNLRAANHVRSLDQHIQVNTDRTTRVLRVPPAIPLRTSSTNAGQTLMQESVPSEPRNSDDASHTSRPVMRASFEREVAKLAQLPDSTEDTNGIESALAKLEGRGDMSPSEPRLESVPEMGAGDSKIDELHQSVEGRHARQKHRKDHLVEYSNLHARTTAQEDVQPPAIVQHSPLSVTGSSLSYSSIPLLERGAGLPPKRTAQVHPVEESASSLSASRRTDDPARSSLQTSETVPGSQNSYDSIEASKNLNAASAGKENASSSRTHESFLLNDNETLSDLSSLTPDDISQQGEQESPGMKSFFEGEADSGRCTPQPAGSETMPRRSETGSVIPRPQNPVPLSPTDDYQVDPAYVPGSRYNTRENSMWSDRQRGQILDELAQQRSRSSPLTKAPSAAHLPFILAHDSLALAQQLTMIERDALCEVDWRDLIDLRWNQTAVAYYNWVEFLRSNGTTDTNGCPTMRPGVDMCIARFNMVVRWVKSEVVLTQDINERVATIVKYIHVAQYARRLRNWATMYQISMALVSADMSRLKLTWAAVPEAERDALAQLEDLIMPTRNFHNLRAEIESATSTWAQEGEGGCIPFIGIYTHDLIYNAQKPARVCTDARGALVDATNLDASERADHQMLINFERQHTAATIVKNLLRLIEASSKYSFQQENDIISQCLWIGALHDAEVTRRSKELEPFERSSA
ncbi:MAG: hypothetical protein Q9159_004716 [Coniocarpon cinnabarinum]